MIYLRSIAIKSSPSSDSFPFNLPLFQNLNKLEFENEVTIIVGENGTGKSTLLEATAAAMKLISIGSDNIDSDPTLNQAREFAKYLKVVKSKHPSRGFFLRTEDLFGFTKRIIKEKSELEALEREYSNTLQGYGRQLAVGTTQGQRKALERRYGDDPDAFSHGEVLLNLLKGRIVPDGFYIMDEPETPLSPLRQLALLSIIKEAVSQNCQFLIATHSPIIMAFPGAKIFYLEDDTITVRRCDEIDHFTIMRDFMNNPEGFLRYL